MTTDKILKAEKEGKTIFGVKETTKALRQGELENVFLAATCPEKIQRDLNAIAAVTKISITKLDVNAEELAAQLKKPFVINVVGIKKK
jgi:ribosomal protein L30E